MIYPNIDDTTSMETVPFYTSMEPTTMTVFVSSRMSHQQRMNIPGPRVHFGIPLTGFGPQRLYRVGIFKGEYPDRQSDSLWIYTAGGMERAHDIACTRYPIAKDGWRITHLQQCQRIGVPPRQT